MSFFTPTIAGIALIFMMAAAAALILCTARIKLQRDAHAVRSSRLEDEITALKLELQKRGAERDHLSRTCAELETALQQKEQHLAHMDADVTWHRDQLAKRPPRTRRTYRILTVGLKYTGKTSLTLKWANPLVDLGALKGTKIERYERTVSASTSSDAIVEHVFEIHDWGGEHIVDAQQELILEEIHGVLLVVDLAGKDGAAPDPARIDEQLRAFQPECLRFFFGPKTLATCKTAVLFINKSDVLSGTPSEVERAAMACYQPLIDALSSYRSQMDLRVLVGSASYGHSTHHLFSHFVERILPKSAYDPQLLQRMKSEQEPTRTAPLPPFPPLAPLPPPVPPAPRGVHAGNGRGIVEAPHARR